MMEVKCGGMADERARFVEDVLLAAGYLSGITDCVVIAKTQAEFSSWDSVYADILDGLEDM